MGRPGKASATMQRSLQPIQGTSAARPGMFEVIRGHSKNMCLNGEEGGGGIAK